jgi:hypothetical protein
VYGFGDWVRSHCFQGRSCECKNLKQNFRRRQTFCAFKFFAPRPPRKVGTHNLSHATRHCDPVHVSSAAQKKALRRASIIFRTEMGTRKEDMKYVGRASRTEERSTSLPPLDRRVARHPARYLSQLSIIGWKAEGGSLVADMGRPRYVCGKEETWVPRVAAVAVARSMWIFIGTRVVLSKLMESPVASAKSCKIFFRFWAAVGVARSMIRVSSAYCKTGQGMSSSRGCARRPSRHAATINCWRTSATVINRYGDRGSPWRRPCLQLIQLPGTPLTRTAVLPVCKSFLIQEQNFGGKPLCSIILRSESQFTESKAFLKSSLTTSVGAFLLWQQFRISAANTIRRCICLE